MIRCSDLMALLTISTEHVLSWDTARGRGAPGGWRHVPQCSCGWNRRTGSWGWKSPRGSMFHDSYATKEQGEEAFREHVGWDESKKVIILLSVPAIARNSRPRTARK